MTHQTPPPTGKPAGKAKGKATGKHSNEPKHGSPAKHAQADTAQTEAAQGNAEQKSAKQASAARDGAAKNGTEQKDAARDNTVQPDTEDKEGKQSKPGSNKPAERGVNKSGKPKSGVNKSGAGKPAKPKRGVQRTITYIEPVSALKMALIFNLALFAVWFVAMALVYIVLGSAGTWDRLDSLIGDLTNSSGFSAGMYFGGVVALGLFEVVLFTLLAPVAALIYNASSSILGGIRIQLDR